MTLPASGGGKGELRSADRSTPGRDGSASTGRLRRRSGRQGDPGRDMHVEGGRVPDRLRRLVILRVPEFAPNRLLIPFDREWDAFAVAHELGIAALTVGQHDI